MRMHRVEVKDRDGNSVAAYLKTCDCGCQTFIVFQLVEQDHMHLQCVHCGTTWCSVRGGCGGGSQ